MSPVSTHCQEVRRTSRRCSIILVPTVHFLSLTLIFSLNWHFPVLTFECWLYNYFINNFLSIKQLRFFLERGQLFLERQTVQMGSCKSEPWHAARALCRQRLLIGALHLLSSLPSAHLSSDLEGLRVMCSWNQTREEKEIRFLKATRLGTHSSPNKMPLQ